MRLMAVLRPSTVRFAQQGFELGKGVLDGIEVRV